jgi:hypothetical protein
MMVTPPASAERAFPLAQGLAGEVDRHEEELQAVSTETAGPLSPSGVGDAAGGHAGCAADAEVAPEPVWGVQASGSRCT